MAKAMAPLPAMPAPLSVREVSVSHDVTEYIRHLILAGHLKAGDKLRTEHLAASIGVSVTPVREALVELMGEGFVFRRPRRGYEVGRLTRAGFEDRVLVLAMVTGELAARAAVAVQQEQLVKLDDLQAELTAADARGDRAEAEAVNHRLHSMINQISGSSELAWTAERLARFMPRYGDGGPADRPRTCSYDHAAVLAALEDHDADRARDEMRAHLVEAGVLLGEELAQSGVWDG